MKTKRQYQAELGASWIIHDMSEFKTLSVLDKPKRIYWDDPLRGGDFTLSENPQPDDNHTWFNGYYRNGYEIINEIHITWAGATTGIDNTTIIQALIDENFTKYNAKNDRKNQMPCIVVPVGDFGVSGIYLRGGTRIRTEGRLIPFGINDTVVHIAGSEITIEKLNIGGNKLIGYVGTMLSCDTTDPVIQNYLSQDRWTKPHFLNAKNINLVGYYGGDSKGLYIHSDAFSRGMSWWDIQHLEIRDCSEAIREVTTNDGYITSVKLKGFLNGNLKNIDIESLAPTNEISHNVYDFDTQAKNVDNVTGIINRGGGDNIFKGTIWDWTPNFGYMVYDTGDGNFFGKGLINSYSDPKTIGLYGKNTITEEKFGSLSSNNFIIDNTDTSYNVIGRQDNIIENLSKLYPNNVIIRDQDLNVINIDTIDMMFEKASTKNWGTRVSWGTKTKIIVDVQFPSNSLVTLGSVAIGFYKAERIARGITIQGSYDGLPISDPAKVFAASKFSVDENLSDRILWRARGYEYDSLRITFENGVDATDKENLLPPSSDILGISSISCYGLAKGTAFARPIENEVLGFSPSGEPAQNNTLFVDSVDDVLKFKSNNGRVDKLDKYRVITDVTEFNQLGVNETKPQHVKWDDPLIGGSFTLSSSPQPDDGTIWYNGYKRDNQFYVTDNMVGAEAVQNIVTISQDDYNALSVIDPNTFFMITG